MTTHGLATTDIDVNSDELSSFRRVEGIVEELRKLSLRHAVL